MDKLVTLTREELYKMVWSEPLNGIAKRYLLTDYALRLICIRFSIPIPRRHHWTQMKAGILSDIPALPKKYKGETDIQFTLHSSSRVAGKKRSQYNKEDPLVTAARKSLLGIDKRDLRNGLAWADLMYLRIGVAPESINRACKIMNQVIVTLRGRGHSLYHSDQSTWVKIGEHPLPIVLRERTRRVYEPKREFSFDRSDMIPSGVLMLQMTYRSKEREWEIGDGTAAEEAARIVNLLEAASRRVDEYRRCLEKYWAESRERERIQKEIKDRHQSELTGFKDLIQTATRWHQAMFMRDYLTALEKYHLSTGELSPDRRAWLAWARAKANWYDPLIEAPDEWLAQINRDTLT